MLAAVGGGSAVAGGALVASTVAAGVSAYGMIQQGKLQAASQELQGRIAQDENNYQAKLDENNAVRAGYAAIQEQQNADREIDATREQRLRVLASQRAALGKSGLTITGSAVDVLSDTSIQMEKEIQMARYRGQIVAYNYSQEASDLRISAGARRAAGSNARLTAGYNARSAIVNSRYSAAGTLLQAAGSIGSKYASFKSS